MTQAGSADILIIGAGFAGLSAALGIRQQGGPTPPTVAVLESRTRPGGRTLTETPDYLDMGGAYVGSSQNFINHLIQEYGIPTFSQYLPQDKLWAWQDGTGAINYLPGDNPWALPGGMPTAELLGEIDAMSLVVRNFLANPWEMPGAETLDAMTAQDFIDTLDVSQATREGMVCSVRSAFSCEPKDVSWLFVLWYAANAGSYAGLVDVTGGEGAAEATRFTYGTGSLIQAMVQDLTQPTSKVAPIPIH